MDRGFLGNFQIAGQCFFEPNSLPEICSQITVSLNRTIFVVYGFQMGVEPKIGVFTVFTPKNGSRENNGLKIPMNKWMIWGEFYNHPYFWFNTQIIQSTNSVSFGIGLVIREKTAQIIGMFWPVLFG